MQEHPHHSSPDSVIQTEESYSEEIITLSAFFKKCIDEKIYGKEMLKLAAEKKINKKYSTLCMMLNKFKRQGISGLQRKVNKNKGERSSFSEEVIRILQSKFINPTGGHGANAYEETHRELRQTAKTFIVRSTGEELQCQRGMLYNVADNKITDIRTTAYESGIYEMNDGTQLFIGSLASSNRFIRDLKASNSDTLFFNRFGVHDFRNKRQHTLRLNYSHLEPNDLITLDGKVLDILIISDDWRTIFRPMLLGCQRASTREYCYHLAKTETSEAIASSLSVAIQNWGIPKVCKHDNGASYKSGRFSQMKEFFGIETSLATVKLARAKMIESMHNIIDNKLKTQIGYTGNKYQEMPQDTKDRLKIVGGHQRDIKKLEKAFKDDPEYAIAMNSEPDARLKKSKKRFMNITELQEVLDRVFAEYHESIHGGLQKDKLGRKAYKVNCEDELLNQLGEKINTPNGRLEYHIAKGFKAVKPDSGLIAIYALCFDLRKVQLTTGIQFNSNDDGEHYYHSKLVKYAGEKVLIRFTNAKPDLLYVFHSEGLQQASHKNQLTKEIMDALKFICIAEKQRLLDYGDQSFKKELALQRHEEKNMREILGKKKYVPETNIIQITGKETEMNEIQNAEQRIADDRKKDSDTAYKNFKLYE